MYPCLSPYCESVLPLKGVDTTREGVCHNQFGSETSVPTRVNIFHTPHTVVSPRSKHCVGLREHDGSATIQPPVVVSTQNSF